VQAQINMASYYSAVERGLPQNCSTDFAASVKFFDDTVKGSDANLKSQVKNAVISAVSGQQVSTSTTDQMDDATVGEYLITPWGQFQSGGPAAIQPFCDLFETAGGQVTPSSSGLSAKTTSDQVFTTMLRALAAIVSSTSRDTDGKLANIGQSNRIPIAAATGDDSSSNNSLPPDSMSWEYQFCTEVCIISSFQTSCLMRHQFGFFQVANSNSTENIVTTLETVDQIEKECNSLFPNMLPSQPQVNNVLKFGGWTQNPTRVMFTNGEREFYLCSTNHPLKLGKR
jgi:hypothetical protein